MRVGWTAWTLGWPFDATSLGFCQGLDSEQIELADTRMGEEDLGHRVTRHETDPWITDDR